MVIELPPQRLLHDLVETRLDRDSADECDRCGATVRRATPAEQVDAPEIPLCPDCEFGEE